MIITKPIHGVMEIKIDEKDGVIWINTCDGYCILRICGLKFKNTEEKFSSIDIIKDNVMIYSNPKLENPDLVSNFLESVLDIVLQKLVTNPIRESSEILTSALENLKKNLQEEK